jgi:competence protein ComGC
MIKNKSLLREIWDFLMERKAWWLVPMIIMLILVGILVVLGQSSAVSPFIYAFF